MLLNNSPPTLVLFRSSDRRPRQSLPYQIFFSLAEKYTKAHGPSIRSITFHTSDVPDSASSNFRPSFSSSLITKPFQSSPFQQSTSLAAEIRGWTVISRPLKCSTDDVKVKDTDPLSVRTAILCVWRESGPREATHGVVSLCSCTAASPDSMETRMPHIHPPLAALP